MTVRKCSTCKYYEPAPIWRKGWCRNPLLYSPQQSHLVGEDDLDCDKGMGNYWEPADGVAVDNAGYEPEGREYEYETAHGSASGLDDEAPALVAPVQFAGLRRKAGDSGNGGEDMGQYPPTGTRRPFGDDEDDEDLAPRGRYGDGGRGGVGGSGGTGGPPGPERQFNYNPDERYWTDYVRIALPVIGVILLLALAWFWINNLIGDKSTPSGTPVAAGLPPIVVTPGASTPTITGTPSHIAGATPTSAAAATPGGGGTLKNGASAVVNGTGGTGVNMRSKPSTSGSVVTKLPEGAKVTITGDSVQAEGYTWWPVKSGNDSGYVVADYLKASP